MSKEMKLKTKRLLSRKIADSLWRKIRQMEGEGINFKTRDKLGEAYKALCDAHYKMDEAAGGF